MHMGESALLDTGRNFGLSGAALKWIATITHAHWSYWGSGDGIWSLLPGRGRLSQASGQWQWTVAVYLSASDAYGWTAILFAVQLPSGRRIFSLRSRKRYTFQMLLFALISEIPFDLAASNRWFYLRIGMFFLSFS